MGIENLVTSLSKDFTRVSVTEPESVSPTISRFLHNFCDTITVLLSITTVLIANNLLLHRSLKLQVLRACHLKAEKCQLKHLVPVKDPIRVVMSTAAPYQTADTLILL